MLVVDEHALSREAICLLLSRLLPDAAVVEIPSIKDGSVPDAGFVSLVLFNLRPPYLKALGALMELRRKFPVAPILVLSDVEDAKVVTMARTRGASGLFHTSDGAEDLMETIRQALAGRPGFPPEQRQKLREADYRFSPRQTDVLDLLCKGKSNKEISAMLNLSGNTVRTHVSAIFNILGVHNRTEAVIFGHNLI